MRYSQAIREGLRDALAEDPNTFLIGIDVGRSGGAFGVTRGLLDEFGPERVVDTPIAEMGILDVAVGAAVSGLRPIVELMFSDFIGVCLDGLLNQAAKVRLMSGGELGAPMTVRTQFGAGGRAGAQHSQSLEWLFAGIPGVKVVSPATPRDAYGLLRSAVADPDPVVFLEHRGLYGLDDETLERDELVPVPLGVARTAVEGSDVTCATYARAAQLCEEAAAQLRDDGGPLVEVIDLRTLAPWDHEAVAESLRRTGRLIVVHEAVEEFGIGAEVAAWVARECFWHLDAPIVRLGAPRTGVAFSPPLEDAYLLGVEEIAQAMRDLAAV